jgi:hypothetical protein
MTENTLTTAAAGGTWWENADKFALIQRAAKMLSTSPLVPPEYQGDKGLGSCVIAMNMAHRMGADPLMVMQNLYVVHGRPGWSSQFLIACFNQTGRFAPIRYDFVGAEGTDQRGCVAVSKDLRTGDEVRGPLVTIEIAKNEGWYSKKGSKWQTIPELMLRYRAAAWMVRTVAPELGMGLQTEDELRDSTTEPMMPELLASPVKPKNRTEALAHRLSPESLQPDPIERGKDKLASPFDGYAARIAAATTLEQLEAVNVEIQQDGDLNDVEAMDLSQQMDERAKVVK